MPAFPRPPALHTSERPSTTAQGVALMRAVEADRSPGRRIVDDPYARLFLAGPAKLARRPISLGRPVIDLAERNRLTGLTTYVLCRHRFIDEHLAAALDDGAEQVLILGAGYDSRAYRFADLIGERPVFEVDLPPLSRRKAAIVERHRAEFGPVTIHRVETDFRTQSLTDRLSGAGFEAGRRTFVVWEGVAPYLSSEAVHETLRTLAALGGPGTTIALDLWDGTGGGDRLAALRRFGAWSLSLVGEPVTFGVEPVAAATLLGEHGFEVIDLAQSAELTERYATLGRIAAASVYVVAAGLRRARP